MMWLWVILALVAVVVLAPIVRERRRLPMDAKARKNASGEFATLSQGVTHYQWHGRARGPVAVCVHGLTTPSFVWDGLVPLLVGMGFRVLTYDHFGRGYSDRTNDAQTADFFLKHLDELLEDQKVDGNITLIGYSMGGAIATAFAARSPARIRRLVLIATAGLSTSLDQKVLKIRDSGLFGDWLMLANFARAHRKGCEAERRLPTTVPTVVDQQLRELKYRGFIDAVLSSLRGVLAQTREEDHRAISRAGMPVLGVWGRDDAVIPLKAMGQMSQWNRTTDHVVIDGAGHGLPYTHTQELADAIAARLSDQD